MAERHERLSGLVVRVDDRLVHGQIVFGWGQSWPADEIWLVDEDVAGDPTQRALYAEQLRGLPRGGILTVEEAAQRFSGRTETGRNVLLVVRTLEAVEALLDRGLRPAEVHLGNVGRGEGRSQVSENVALSPDEIERAGRFAARCGRVVIRSLPVSPPIPIQRINQQESRQ